MHKRQNIAEHLPESERTWVDAKLVRALNNTDAAAGLPELLSPVPTYRNVTRWRDGQMVLRWTAAGMSNAQRSFRRVKGYKQMSSSPRRCADTPTPSPPSTTNLSPPRHNIRSDRHSSSTISVTPSIKASHPFPGKVRRLEYFNTTGPM